MNNDEDKDIVDIKKEEVNINSFAIKQGIIEFLLGVLSVVGGICTFVEFILIFLVFLLCFPFLILGTRFENVLQQLLEQLLLVFQRPYFWIGVLLLILRYILGKINKKYENKMLKKL